jgi:protein SCO1/2
MNNPDRKSHLPLVLSLLGVIAVLVTLAVLRLSAPPQEMDLQRLGVVEFPQPRDFQWPAMVDEQATPFEREQLLGVWTLIFFGFTHCPDICPATISVFSRTEERLAQDDMRHDTRYVMVSVDPKRDTPERLKQWMKQFSPSLKALHGELATVRKLARDFSVSFQKSPYSGSDYTINHSANVFLVGPDGKQYGFVRSVSNAQTLEQAYRAIRTRFELSRG